MLPKSLKQELKELKLKPKEDKTKESTPDETKGRSNKLKANK